MNILYSQIGLFKIKKLMTVSDITDAIKNIFISYRFSIQKNFLYKEMIFYIIL